MYVRRHFTILQVLAFSWFHVAWLTLWAIVAYSLYHLLDFSWLAIPWLPISSVAIAVAFYVGFKNNSAYDRMWEARKVWGSIVNDSRSWAISSRHYLTDIFAKDNLSSEQLKKESTQLINRHIAWLYTLREQLMVVTPWEHLSGSWGIRKVAKERRKRWGIDSVEVESLDSILSKNLATNEIERLQKVSNKATQLLDMQAKNIEDLRKDNVIDDFRYIDLQQSLYKFYESQGKCERLKNYPFPRQYAFMSTIFIAIFIVLLPFGLMPEFAKLGAEKTILAIPFTALIGWVFVMMELVGDYSENPFEGMANSIPMLSMCRTIEIDLREMMQEENVPEKIEIVNDVLH